MTFFVSGVGAGRGADFGGIEGADKHCQQLAWQVGAGYRAWRTYLSQSAWGSDLPINTLATASARARGRTQKGSSSRTISTSCTAITTSTSRPR
jgi:hypothetical protein